MVENADASNNLSDAEKSLLQVALEGIGRVTDDLGALGDLFSLSDSSNLSVFENDFIDISIEHEGSSVDGTHSGESLWNSSQSVDWIDEWRITVSSVRVHVELDFLDSVNSWLLKEIVVGIESDGVSQEISSVWLKLELLDDLGEWL